MMELKELDRLEVTVLVDNYTDITLMDDSATVKRGTVRPPDALLAEHGFSCLIKTAAGGEEHVYLMDAGISGTCLLHNAELLKVNMGQVEGFILSHGHFDHFGGLGKVLPVLPGGIPVILHPDAFRKRRLNIVPLERQVPMPPLEERDLEKEGVTIRKAREDCILGSGQVLVLGEIERATEFETGFPWAEAAVDGSWVKDPFTDDRGVAFKVKNRGLVVIGGCSHAGIINTVKHAQKISGTGKVHAVMGGFHLTGPLFEPVIKPTIEEMKKINPDFIVPAHCTGWKAINELAKEMPEQFVLNSVGTTYTFEET